MKDYMIYTGFLNHDRYAYSNGKQVIKTLWEKHFGDIPQGLELAHIWDLPACINLAHVYLATHAENMADRYRHLGLPQQTKREIWKRASAKYYRKKRQVSE